MGIPAYFSYIIKNHSNIIQKLEKNKLQINNLYFDANSIIYDVIHKVDFTKVNESDVNSIIKLVFQKIDEYINIIKPTTNIFIGFDGTCPKAKLEQQRTRRYKSTYQSQISKNIFKNTTIDPFNTVAITPGTLFMHTLNNKMKEYFINPKHYNVQNLIISPSNKFGEGEQKIFEFIREYPDYHHNSTTVVYGIDSDLIMLCINHLPISSKIFLYRETPEFIKSINSELDPSESYIIDIPELTKIITLNMNNNIELNTEQQKNRIYDYIFLCFFLGNDFLPHFPSVNIRTGGIDKLLNAYKETIGNTNENLTNGKQIFWKNVKKIVSFLANLEENNFKIEMKSRDKKSKIFFPIETPEEQFKKFESIPTYERELEKFINPYKENWQKRYYKTLFFIDDDENRKKQICINYLEGLEWTMKYYTTGCPDWKWNYNYNYPPLFSDLVNFIPYFDTEFITNKDPEPVSELVQLAYVLPRQSLHLLPKELHEKLLEKYGHLYKSDCEFIWAFCRYFWESHVLLPEININDLEDFINKK
jgi:5'-3' exonuclease